MKNKIKKILANKFFKKFVLHFGCAIITLSWLAYNKQTCDLSDNPLAMSSINRTESEECRDLIRNFACDLLKQSQKPTVLHSQCPFESVWKGCMSREDLVNLLSNESTGLKYEFDQVVGTEYCLGKCASSFGNDFELMAYDAFTNSCLCFSLPVGQNDEHFKLSDCDGVVNNYTVYSIIFPSNQLKFLDFVDNFR